MKVELRKSQATTKPNYKLNNVSDNVVIVSEFKRKINIFKPIFILLIVILIVLLSTLLVFLSRGNKKNSVICGNTVIKNAISSFKNDNAAAQESIAKQIQNTPGYKNSPNCMYILSVYQIESANSVSAQNDINLLAALINKGNKPDPQLTNYISIKSLKYDLNSLNLRIKQDMNNIINVSHS
jgi:hypothetical protein